MSRKQETLQALVEQFRFSQCSNRRNNKQYSTTCPDHHPKLHANHCNNGDTIGLVQYGSHCNLRLTCRLEISSHLASFPTSIGQMSVHTPYLMRISLISICDHLSNTYTVQWYGARSIGVCLTRDSMLAALNDSDRCGKSKSESDLVMLVAFRQHASQMTR